MKVQAVWHANYVRQLLHVRNSSLLEYFYLGKERKTMLSADWKWTYTGLGTRCSNMEGFPSTESKMYMELK